MIAGLVEVVVAGGSASGLGKRATCAAAAGRLPMLVTSVSYVAVHRNDDHHRDVDLLAHNGGLDAAAAPPLPRPLTGGRRLVSVPCARGREEGRPFSLGAIPPTGAIVPLAAGLLRVVAVVALES